VAIIAAAIVWIAYDDGSYGLPARATLAIAVLWGIVIGLALRVLSLSRLPRGAVVVGGFLAATAAWTLVSVAWAPSAEAAFAEFNRAALFLAVYVLVVLAGRRETVGRWADALAIGIAVVSVVALVSRLFPGSLPDRDLPAFLPSAATRLSFPLGYWNGLAIFVALGVPLLLRIALLRRHGRLGAVALALAPVSVSVVYLASSRGGFLALAVGSLVFLVLTDERWSAAGATLVAAVASAVAIGFLHSRSELVNGPLDSDLARDQGLVAALLVVLTCLAVGVSYRYGVRLLGPRLRLGRTAGRAAVAFAVLVVIVGIVVADPASRFETFKRVPDETSVQGDDFVRAHLLSGNGSGRWQFWSAAVDQWREYPVLGQGAGTYESWWAEHASFTYFVRDAHSRYLEALGELGIIGVVLAVGLVLSGIAVGAGRSLRLEGELRVTSAALTASVAAYAVTAGLDWLWELTAVSVVAVVALALTSGPATAIYTPARAVRTGESPGFAARHRVAMAASVALVAWVLICGQAISLLSDRELARSRAAVADGNFPRAASAAEAARNIQPWAATPYLQLALVSEAAGDLPRSRIWIGEAVERNKRDWRLWLVAARIEAKLGRTQAAERNLRRAVALNPRSPLFEGLLERESID
jgi:O-Antigen ligase